MKEKGKEVRKLYKDYETLHSILSTYTDLYLKIQRSRGSLEKRLEKMKEKFSEEEFKDDMRTFETTHAWFLDMEKKFLARAKEIIGEEHPLWKFAENIKGLSYIAIMTFMGVIDIKKATSAGKVWAKFGLGVNEEGKAWRKVSGEKTRFNPLLKGRAWLMIRNIILAKGEPYYSLYLMRKEYYSNRPDRLALKDKEKGWKAHNDNMTKRWTLKLLLSHMWEICRRYEGLPIPKHKNYIAPPPLNTSDFTDYIEKVRKIMEKIKEEEYKKYNK